MRLKISVLASGAILLDGQPGDLELLDAALERAKQDHGQVWYYRELAGAPPPAAGLAVIQRVVQRKLPISLSSKPDFSDWVDGQGVSHPRAAEGPAAGAPPGAPAAGPSAARGCDTPCPSTQSEKSGLLDRLIGSLRCTTRWITANPAAGGAAPANSR